MTAMEFLAAVAASLCVGFAAVVAGNILNADHKDKGGGR